MPADSRDPDLVNPAWWRPASWPYEEDHDSPKWQRRMARMNRKLQLGRELYGFCTCPECGVMHTGLTVVCRSCGHAVKVTDAQRAVVERRIAEE